MEAHAGLLASDPNGGLELGPGSSTGATPYIDFHYGTGTLQDYNVRLINVANNRLDLSTASNGAVLTVAGGSVGIGTTSPQHLLHVAGTIGAEEVIVSSTGADYVFGHDYRLQALSEIADYVKKNGHLPDIPSAEEVKQKGIGIGEMQTKLLAKIEELTLHMIEADKENKRLEETNRQLQERVARLEASGGSRKP